MCYLCANFFLSRHLCSQLRPNVCDRQTSDTHHCLVPPPRGRGGIIRVRTMPRFPTDSNTICTGFIHISQTSIYLFIYLFIMKIVLKVSSSKITFIVIHRILIFSKFIQPILKCRDGRNAAAILCLNV